MLETLIFLAGLQMMIELLAAGYRFIDLWYRIEEHWQRLSLKFAAWVILDMAVLNLLNPELSEIFLWGQACFLLFHISIYWIIRAVFTIVSLSRR